MRRACRRSRRSCRPTLDQRGVGVEREARIERLAGDEQLREDDDERRRPATARIEIERQRDERPDPAGQARPAVLAGRVASCRLGLRSAVRASRVRAAGRHQQADLVLVGRPAVDASPTIRPRYMTAIRSDSSRTSSSSAETSRTAVPASRFAIAWRWMNSMLPTSRPRVGWSRMSSFSVAVELAGDDDLLLVAARQRARVTSARRRPDVELRRSARSAASSIAPSSRRMPRANGGR